MELSPEARWWIAAACVLFSGALTTVAAHMAFTATARVSLGDRLVGAAWRTGLTLGAAVIAGAIAVQTADAPATSMQGGAGTTALYAMVGVASVVSSVSVAGTSISRRTGRLLVLGMAFATAGIAAILYQAFVVHPALSAGAVALVIALTWLKMRRDRAREARMRAVYEGRDPDAPV